MTKKQKILKVINSHKKAAWATAGIISLSTFTAAAHFMTSGSSPVVPVKIPVVTNPKSNFLSGNSQTAEKPTTNSNNNDGNTSTDMNSDDSASNQPNSNLATNPTSNSTANTSGANTSSSGSSSGSLPSGNSSGGSSGGGSSTTPPNSPPTAPTSATATIVMYNRVTIRVNRATDSDGIARHELLRNGSVVVTSTSTSNPLTLSDTSVAVGQTYTYTVRAVDTLGVVGLSSNSVVVTIPPQDTNPPTIPTNFRITSNVPGSVTFAWDPSTDDQTTQGDLWYILSSPADGSNFYTWTQINPRSTGWFDQPGATHDVYIQAVDAAGNESAQAGPVTFTAQ